MSFQKKAKSVNGNFAKVLAVGVVLTAGMAMTAPEAHAQNNRTPTTVGEAKEEAKKVAVGTVWNILMGGVQDAKDVIEHERNERVATRKTESSARHGATREAIVTGNGAQGSGDMVANREIRVQTQSGSSGSPSHTVRTTETYNNRTASQIEQQRQRDAYNRERQVNNAHTQQEVQAIRSGQQTAPVQGGMTAQEIEVMRIQLEQQRLENERLRMQLELAQLSAGDSTVLSGNAQQFAEVAGTPQTAPSERDLQMIGRCNTIAQTSSVVPERCQDLQRAFPNHFTPRR